MKNLYETPIAEMTKINTSDVMTSSGGVSLFSGTASEVQGEDVHSFSSLF